MQDAAVPQELEALVDDARVTVRRGGAPDPGGQCVVYWMQRAQRGRDNHALDLAVQVGNTLGLPVVVYFAGISNFPNANLRHYVFLNQGLVDVSDDLAERNVSFVLRNAPNESHERLLKDVRAALCIGDENPMREPERWRKDLAERLRIPFWTVDADVVVPTRRVEKAQYAAYTMRPRLYRLLPEYLVPYENPRAEIAWQRPNGLFENDPRQDMTRGWKDLDRTVGPVEAWRGGHHAGMKRLREFTGRAA